MSLHGRVRARGNQMFIIAARQKDAGEYTCEVTIDQETKQHKVPLTFYSEDLSLKTLFTLPNACRSRRLCRCAHAAAPDRG